MNHTLEVINNRRSVRSYSEQPILPEERDAILSATFRAPTAGNQMLYSIIEVTDQHLKERLAVTCDDQPFIAKAPLVLIFLADYQRWWDYFQHCEVERRADELNLKQRKPQEGDMLLACSDAVIAAQTAVIAAESLGIGSCYIGDVLENYEIHRDLLSLPPYALPIAMVCFGYPAKTEGLPALQPRFEREFILHQNRYQRFTGEEMEKMFQPFKDRYFSSGTFPLNAENIGQVYYLRKFISEFSCEMSRSVREMLKNWSPGNQE
ncbi:MAG: nitroreductase [Anaerolineaceae bacterium]|nr:nitroreductase [Anaerolineaceae bacterium]